MAGRRRLGVGVDRPPDMTGREYDIVPVMPVDHLRGRPAGRGEAYQGVGVHTWALMFVAAVSVAVPDVGLRYGPFVCAFAIIASRPERFRPSLTDVLAVGLVALMWASRTWAFDKAAATSSTLIYSAVLLIFIVFRAVIQDRRQLRAVAGAYVAGCLVAVGRVVYENPAARMPVDITADRYTVNGINANFLAYAFVLGLAMIVLLWVTSSRTVALRTLLTCSALVFCTGVLLSGSRGALIGVIFLGSWIALYRISSRRMLFGLVVLLVLINGGIVTGDLDRTLTVLESITTARASGTLSGRLFIWPLAREVWFDHAVLGIGNGGFHATNSRGLHAHNCILELGADLGVVGVGMFVGILVTALRWPGGGHATASSILMVGSFLIAAAPAYLSGSWESAAPAWVMLAIFSRVSVVAVGRDPDGGDGKAHS